MDATSVSKPSSLRFVNGALLVLASILIVAGVRQLQPAAPSIEKQALSMDAVKRGDFVQEVRGAGNLAATDSGVKAVIRVPKDQTFDLAVGQDASVAVGADDVAARVTALDGMILAGTLGVELELIGELPCGARPGLSVDARIRLRTIPEVL